MLKGTEGSEDFRGNCGGFGAQGVASDAKSFGGGGFVFATDGGTAAQWVALYAA